MLAVLGWEQAHCYCGKSGSCHLDLVAVQQDAALGLQFHSQVGYRVIN